MKRILLAAALIAPLFNPISAAAFQVEKDIQGITRIEERIARARAQARWDRWVSEVQMRLQAATAQRMQARYEELEVTGPTYVDAAGICWDCIAECESGGNWSINTGNGYYGGLQFAEATWLGAGGPAWSGFHDPWLPPFPFSREQQIAVASRLSLSAWPHCQVYA